MKGARGWLALAAGLATGAVAIGLIGPALKRQNRAADATADGGALCAPIDISLAPQEAQTGQALTRVLAGPGVDVRIDGVPVTPETLMLSAGRHRFEAKARAAVGVHSQFQFEVTSLKPVLLEALRDGPSITVLMLGARCSQCAVSAETLSLQRLTVDNAALDEAATALSITDWQAAVDALSASSLAERKSARFERQVAIAESFSGHPEAARERFFRTRGSVLKALLEKDEALEATRERQVLLTEWNDLTARYSTVINTFSFSAPAPTAAASARFSQLSEAFSEAAHRQDLKSQRRLVTAGRQTLEELLRAVNATFPRDCEVQRQLVKVAGAATP